MVKQSYVDRLLPTLLDFWIEASPLVFGGEVIDASPSLALLQSCMRMINYLNCASPHAKTYRAQITKYISPEFPFGSPKRFSYRDGKVASVLQEMNAQYCEMACHLYDAGDKGSQWLPPLLDYLALSLTVSVIPQ